jgi:hypothetical protein
MPNLGNYTLHEELGRGRFTTVYYTTEDVLDREEALKVLVYALICIV